MNEDVHTICFLSTSHDATDARVFHREAVSLAEAGYDVTYYTPFSPTETVDGVDIRSVELDGIDTDGGDGPPLPEVADRLRTAFALLRTLYDTDYDVYHFHDVELLPVGVALSVLTNGRVVYDVHEDVEHVVGHKDLFPRPLRPLLSRVVSTLERRLAASVDGVIAASADIAARFADHDNTVIVTNYPARRWAENAEETALTADEDGEGVQFVYCGLLSELRGIPTVIEAIEAVPEEHDVSLVIGGKYASEDDRRRIEQAARGTDRVELVGWLPSLAAVIDLFYESDVGVMCFEPEPNKTHAAHRSNKLFQYMAARLPIIVSDVGNWTDVVEGNDCGIAVDPTDPERIAAAMTALVEDPDRRARFAENGHRAALETYNWETQRERLLGLYDRL